MQLKVVPMIFTNGSDNYFPEVPQWQKEQLICQPPATGRVHEVSARHCRGRRPLSTGHNGGTYAIPWRGSDLTW